MFALDERRKTREDVGTPDQAKDHAPMQPTQTQTMGQKVSLVDLTDLARKDRSGLSDLTGDPAIISFKESGFKFDFIWRPRPGAKRIYVFFAGDADRVKREPPVFHRWKWADRFDGHCLFVADPTLFLERTMGLGWYVGNERFDCFDVIAPVVESLAVQSGIYRRNIISYGSSGGGFAALRLGERLSGITVVAINPQTDITVYHGRSADKFLRVCFGKRPREQARADFPHRLVVGGADSALHRCRIIYAQNMVDLHHYEAHFKPFCDRMGLDAAKPTAGFTTILFSHPAGHAKAETSDVLAAILAQTEQD